MKHLLFITILSFSFSINAQILENTKKEIPVVIPLDNADQINKSTDLLNLPITTQNDNKSLLEKPKKEVDFTSKSNLVHRKIEFNPNYGVINAHKEKSMMPPKETNFLVIFSTTENLFVFIVVTIRLLTVIE